MLFKNIFTLKEFKTNLINDLFTFGHHRKIGLVVVCAEMGDAVNAERYFNKTINDVVRPEAYRDNCKKIARKYMTG